MLELRDKPNSAPPCYETSKSSPSAEGWFQLLSCMRAPLYLSHLGSCTCPHCTLCLTKTEERTPAVPTLCLCSCCSLCRYSNLYLHVCPWSPSAGFTLNKASREPSTLPFCTLKAMVLKAWPMEPWEEESSINYHGESTRSKLFFFIIVLGC